MIQDMETGKMNNQYEAKEPVTDSYVMAFCGNAIYRKKQDELEFLTYGELKAACKETKADLPALIYLFSIGEKHFYLAELSCLLQDLLEAEGYVYTRMFETRSMVPKAHIFAAATAWHLYVWYRDNQFCGRCGKPLVHDAKQRMLKCPDCGNMVFPKVAPAVIVGVTKGSKILMTKYAGREYKRYALIAGFTEIGETAEETVAREVLEEVGLKVKNIRYYKSQPWGFDSNLLLGYFCELDGEDIITLEEEELAMAEWVDCKDISDDTEGLSLTKEMMIYFRESFT